MNANDSDLENMEKRLGRLAMGGPGPEVRARILSAAREAWRNSPANGRRPWLLEVWRNDLFRVAAALAVCVLIAFAVQLLDSRLTAAVARAGALKPVAAPSAMPSPREMAEWVGMNGDITAYLKVVETLGRLPAPAQVSRVVGSLNRQDMEQLL